MKKNYLHSLIILLALFSTTAGISQSVPIYATTQTATVGAEITSATNGPGTYMGDHIVLAGTERYLNSIDVRVFNIVNAAPFTLTVRLYTDCMSTAAGCGSGPGTLIPGSEVVVTVTPTVTVGTIFNVTIPFSGLDLSSETDNGIAVMMNASRSDVYWVLDESVTTGSNPAGETADSVVIRCGSTAQTSNGCTRAFTDVTNNFAMIVNASSQLGIDDVVSDKKILVFPNPALDLVTISLDDTIERISVIDYTGRIVRTHSYNDGNQVEMNLDGLSAGNYLLKVQSSDNVLLTKLIKR